MVNIISNPERREDAECINFFNTLKGLRDVKLIKGVFFHVPNQLSSKNNHISFMSKLARMGKIAGVSDYIFLWNDGCGCLEFKVKGNGLSPAQIAFQKWCVEQNISYEVVYSTQEGLDVLHTWGLIPKVPEIKLQGLY